MTHITFGLFRAGVKEPATRLAAAGDGPSFPTPYSMATAAISRHHRESPAAAERALNRTISRSPYWGPSGPPQARGWADSIRRCYATYRRLAEDDTRPAIAWSLNRELVLGPDDLSVHVDVVLLDPRGYVARVVLWDTGDLTANRAALYAAPVWAVLEAELGEGRVAGVEVWHLRTGSEVFVDADTASAALPAAENLVHLIAS